MVSRFPACLLPLQNHETLHLEARFNLPRDLFIQALVLLDDSTYGGFGFRTETEGMETQHE